MSQALASPIPLDALNTTIKKMAWIVLVIVEGLSAANS